MTMRLYLVRHATAKSKEEDPERPLSPAGEAEVGRVARALDGRPGVEPARIYHSGKTRARETAEILARELAVREVLEDPEALSPNADPSAWDQRLENLTEDLMLVGHLPHVQRLAGHLLEGDPDAEPVSFGAATVACLEREEAGGWNLHWDERPA